MKFQRLLAPVLTASLVFGQKDVPVNAGDLADKIAAAKKSHQKDLAVLIQVRNYIESETEGGTTNDLRKLASLADVELRACLLQGDYRRNEMRLYAAAAEAAGGDAAELAQMAEKPSSSGGAEARMRNELEEAVRQKQALDAKENKSAADLSEIARLEGTIKEIRTYLALFMGITSGVLNKDKYLSGAAKLRGQQEKFSLLARSAGHQSLVHDIRCLAVLESLRELAEREKIQAKLDRWLPRSGTPAAPREAPPSAPTAPLTPAIDDVQKLKTTLDQITAEIGRIDQFLHDPARLQRMVDKQKSIAQP